MARFCDNADCGIRPASRRQHPQGVRLCSVCEQIFYVDDRGSIIPRSSFDGFLASCVADSVEGR